ncbi:unnamed protein product [Didymodactylos carnosus]|uniref:NmrA-like domain-containing protein n=1 Tax=Didymodactylos carnosus TaxID=1234261 RepID=A0A814VUZ8_9BILA|nr:unnamed protein product [Didymodactylos carnosus]CAF1193170.1 unnamed protein product [Didymodactylos carnosus]CAF3618128.1 unnamed protein product [Didymodactylos carnosus]CAF3957461.1 unnamed protein product [Didymodactylos carnosus]
MAKTVAIAGAGDVAKYVVEALESTPHKIVVLSRSNRPWFSGRKSIEIRLTDYTFSSLKLLLEDVDVLISLLHDNTDFYNAAHLAMIEACQSPSVKCKRFIPSECGGDIEKFPDYPLFYVPTHGAIRKVLKDQNDVEYTLFNLGWFMDYFVEQPGKSYMKNIQPVWPLNLNAKKIRIRDCDEPVTFTAGRNVGQALARLVDVPKWEEYTYVEGETTTWNAVVDMVQKKMPGVRLEIERRSLEEIEESRKQHENDVDKKQLWFDFMDQWNGTGAASVPLEKARRQREMYFKGIHFYKIEEFMQLGEKTDGVV